MRSSPVPPKRASTQGIQERLDRSFRRIPTEDTPRVFRVRLAEIEPNPDQPRTRIDDEALRELAASIGRHGLIQPVTVKRLTEGDRYLLVAGERRYRAHELLGREDILAIVTTGDPDEISLIENLQRQDLHPLEEAAAYARVMRRHGWTQEQLATAVGKARPTITNLLKLNGLCEAIRIEAAAAGNTASRSVLFEVARLDDPAAQMALWRELKDGATVRAARARKEPTAPSPPFKSTLAAGVLAGRRFLRKLLEIPADAARPSGECYEELLQLREQIDQALRRFEPERPSG
jgi:ParB family transcriptional regulator, chromosome partitioning protein